MGLKVIPQQQQEERVYVEEVNWEEEATKDVLRFETSISVC